MPFNRVTSSLLTILVLLFSTPVLSQQKPNVILILTDDQGWGDLSLHGNPWLETPQLDRLARGGVRFQNCYASPLCAPTRASLLTGRYHLSTGVLSVSNGLEVMDTEETTLAELFKANHYATGIFGKWHNGSHFPSRPIDQGFDEFVGFCAGHWSNYFNTTLAYNETYKKTSGYITDVLTDAALAFIERNKTRPFFCYIPYNAPHSPHQVPDKYFIKYKSKGLDDERASVYGMVENIDDNVGKIMRYLQDNNLGNNTIVVFMSDNGPNGNRYNGKLRGIKGSVHEGGVKVPFFVTWPGKIPVNKELKTPVAHIDIYPTLQALCGLNPAGQKTIDGVDLSTMILNAEEDLSLNDRKIFTHVNFMKLPPEPDLGGFRVGNHRFVMENATPGLYDLAKDPEQQENIADANPQLRDRYIAAYQEWFSNGIKDLKIERSIALTARGTELPAYEAILTPGIKFKEGHGWAHDFIEVWNQERDSMSWEIDCNEPGRYLIEMDYAVEKKNVGSQLVCRVGPYTQAAIVTPAAKTTQLKSPDRIKRKEAYEVVNWKSLKLGEFSIAEGRHRITLRASKVLGTNVAEVRALRVLYVGNR